MKPKRSSQLVTSGEAKRVKMSQRGTATESHLGLLREEKCCDVTFLVNGSTRIACHKSFLVARSPVFEAMFSERWNNNNNNELNREIPLPDAEAKTVRMFLEYVYADVFCVQTIWEALGLLNIAQKYDVQLLVERCERKIERGLNLKDCVLVFETAKLIGNEKCMKLAGDMMANAKSLEAIATGENLENMGKSTLIYLLERCDVAAKEVELFKVALQWGNIQVQIGAAKTADEALVDVIPLVRFPVMTLNEFTSVVVPTGILKQDVAIEIFTYFGSEKAVQKNLEKSLKFSTVPRKPLGTDTVISFYDESITDEERTKKMLLTDHIGFHVQVASTPGLAIGGIILRCPMKDLAHGPEQCSSTGSRNEDDFFRISILKSYFFPRRYSDDMDFEGSIFFSKEMVISPVKLQWGQDMEVKVDPPVLLQESYYYVIILQQVQDSRKEYVYKYRRLGGLVPNAQVKANLNSRFLCIAPEPGNASSGICVIYKIRLVEY